MRIEAEINGLKYNIEAPDLNACIEMVKTIAAGTPEPDPAILKLYEIKVLNQ